MVPRLAFDDDGDGGNGLVDGKKSWCFGLRYKLYGRFARGRKLEHMYSGYIPF